MDLVFAEFAKPVILTGPYKFRFLLFIFFALLLEISEQTLSFQNLSDHDDI